jgi:SAM-dependent methyltransferase
MFEYSLPLLYHSYHNRHLEDLPFWLDLAGEQGSPLLELGCGTGRVLQPLSQAGYQVVGLDRDPEMLMFLRGQWPVEAGAPPIFQADMAHFHLASYFKAILLPCNTLSTLSRPRRLSMFQRAAAQLAPGGLFAASLPNPEVLRTLPARSESEVEDVFYSPVEGDPIQVSSAWERSAGFFTVSMHYDHLLPDGRVQRFTMMASHVLTQKDAYLSELKQAGFEIEAVCGDFDRSPYAPDSPNLIILAARPG